MDPSQNNTNRVQKPGLRLDSASNERKMPGTSTPSPSTSRSVTTGTNSSAISESPASPVALDARHILERETDASAVNGLVHQQPRQREKLMSGNSSCVDNLSQMPGSKAQAVAGAQSSGGSGHSGIPIGGYIKNSFRNVFGSAPTTNYERFLAEDELPLGSNIVESSSDEGKKEIRKLGSSGHVGIPIGGGSGNNFRIAAISRSAPTTEMEKSDAGGVQEKLLRDAEKKAKIKRIVGIRQRYNVGERIQELGFMLPRRNVEHRSQGKVMEVQSSYVRDLQRVRSLLALTTARTRHLEDRTVQDAAEIKFLEDVIQRNGLKVPPAHLPPLPRMPSNTNQEEEEEDDTSPDRLPSSSGDQSPLSTDDPGTSEGDQPSSDPSVSQMSPVIQWDPAGFSPDGHNQMDN